MTEQQTPDAENYREEVADSDEQSLLRRQKLAALREQGNPYPNDFRREDFALYLIEKYEHWTTERLEEQPIRVALAGRMKTRRIMGKASFAHLQDMTGQLQIYVQRDVLPEGFYNDEFKRWDIGDILGVEGSLFKTKTGELTIRVENVRLLVKALHPLPEKWHGLQNQEAKYRQRYLDLMMNEETRNRFKLRTKVVENIRQFLNERDYLEVETPMMQPLPGGANARPFVTHHNALDMRLYLRIAPELYLKRLLVGGFDKVFEINRNFRNEGLSTRHNPEFTMLEFYQAYADYNDLMLMTEEMLRALVAALFGETSIEYQGHQLEFGGHFERLSIIEAIHKYKPQYSLEALADPGLVLQIAAEHDIHLEPGTGAGKAQLELFERFAEAHLIQPTFITGFSAEVSPLARRNDHNAELVDRFELFIAGKEIANGFSELNDAEDQAQRFRQQVDLKSSGDAEAMYYDEDYIRALEYGMPPAAGEGIGIDRLVMLLSDSPSIRDVILFPHLRPE